MHEQSTTSAACIEAGQVRPQNSAPSAACRYQEAADRHLPLAMYNLGEFAERLAVRRKPLNSLERYSGRLAANEQAMERLGAIYENGDLHEKADAQAAQQWYDKAQAVLHNKSA